MNRKPCSGHSTGQVPPLMQSPTTVQLLWRSLGLILAFPCDQQALLLGRGCCQDHRGRCLEASQALSGMCVGVAADISPPPSFPFTSKHLLPDPFFLLFLLLGAPLCTPPAQRCYKQDMGSLAICKQEWLKVFNSIPAVNRDKGGSAVWSRE